MALIMGVQIIGILFALFMIYYTYLNYKRKQLEKGEFAAWLILWFAFLGVAIYPAPLRMMAETLSVSNTIDFLTIIGFFFLIILTFYNYVQVRKNDQKLEKLVRKIAFKKANGSRKRTKR